MRMAQSHQPEMYLCLSKDLNANVQKNISSILHPTHLPISPIAKLQQESILARKKDSQLLTTPEET